MMLHFFLVLLPALCQSNVEVERVSESFSVAPNVDRAVVQSVHGGLLARERLYFRSSGRYTRDVRQGEQHESAAVRLAGSQGGAAMRSRGSLFVDKGRGKEVELWSVRGARGRLRKVVKTIPRLLLAQGDGSGWLTKEAG